tara:strand:+ start:855 stop:1436 length:582 start_codon:yes stop_codon:yes gene_type:complete
VGRVGHIWPVFDKKISTSKGAPVATSRIPSEKELQDAAYAQAQDAIAKARASGASYLTLSTADLAVVPQDIGTLTVLTDLSLGRSPVSDISALSGLTALSFLDLSDTQVSDISALSGLQELNLMGTSVSDLSPLLRLTQLAADDHGSAGLAFQNTAAALADPRIPGSPKSPILRTIPSAPPICLPICAKFQKA